MGVSQFTSVSFGSGQDEKMKRQGRSMNGMEKRKIRPMEYMGDAHLSPLLKYTF